MTNHELLLACARGHRYAPGALEVALAAFSAMPKRQQQKAANVYRTLLAERSLPKNWGRK